MSPRQAQKFLILAGALGLASVLTASPVQAIASAKASIETIQGQYVRLISVADWGAATGMRPGGQVQWDIAASANAPEPGIITLGVSATGGVALIVDAEFCAQEWAANGCPGGARVLQTGWNVPRDGVEVSLTTFDASKSGHLRLLVALAPTGDQGSTELRVHAHGQGESIVVGPGNDLAVTGMSPSMPWLLGGGAVLAVVGVLLVASRRRTTREVESC